MDELITRITARLDRQAEAYDHAGRIAGTEADKVMIVMAESMRSAAQIVREEWDAEQARITNEERADPGYSMPDSMIDVLSADGGQR
jgi:hypothetical protein